LSEKRVEKVAEEVFEGYIAEHEKEV